MTARAVLDASGAVHLVLNGQHAPRLAAKLEEVAIVTAPDLFCSEVANALLKYVRAGNFTLDLAVTRFEECMGLADSLIPERALAPEALADALERLLADPGLRVRLAEEGRRLMETDFDIHRNTARRRAMFALCRTSTARAATPAKPSTGQGSPSATAVTGSDNAAAIDAFALRDR